MALLNANVEGTPASPEALRALLVWPAGAPPSALLGLLQQAGVGLDVALSPQAAIAVARARDHAVVLAPPPTAAEDLWLSPLLAEVPTLETIALVDPHDPQAAQARRAGADELSDLKTLPAADLAHLVARAMQRSRLRSENLQLKRQRVEADRLESWHAQSLELLSTLEIETLQDLLLKVFCELTGAERAALWVRTPRGLLMLRSHRGRWDLDPLSPQIDPTDGPLASRIDGGLPFGTTDHAGPQTAAPRLYVPLPLGGQPIGLILLADKRAGDFNGLDLTATQRLTTAAATALRNARRFHELERSGLRDRESPTYNLSYFIDYAGKELYKSSRYGRQFSLSTLRIDNLDHLRSRLSPAQFTEAIRALIVALAGLARDSDVLSRVADNELYLILPETDRFGVMMLERRVIDAVRALDEGAGDQRPPISLTMGSATYPSDGHDFDELLHRCRQRAAESRLTLRRRLQLTDLDFWQSFAALLGPWPTRLEAQIGAETTTAAASYRGPLPEEHFARVQREIGREIAREPRARGLLYLGSGDSEPIFPLLEVLPAELAARVCVLTRRGQRRVDHPAVSTVFVPAAGPSAAPQAQHEFLLYLSESAAYAYARRRREPIAFHTSDRPLVDHLLSRLQQAYDLQPY